MAVKREQQALARMIREAARPGQTVAPRCRHFGDCGGCDLQHLPYPAQLRLKRQLVAAALAQHPQTSPLPVLEVAPAHEQWRYRNKVEMTFDQREDGALILGYSPKRKWWRRIDIEDCWLCSERAMGAALAVKQWAAQAGMAPYDQRRHQGFLRNLALRESRFTGDFLVNLVTAQGPPPARELLHALAPFAPSGVVRTIHSGPAAAVLYERVEVLAGEATVRERAAGLTFHLSPQSFFQPNGAMASRLVELAAGAADLRGAERLLDMFCGVGTIGLALAARAREVVGVESVAAAVTGARDNAAVNAIANARFECATARAYLRDHRGEVFEVVILDPPRPGCGPRVVRRLLEMRPRRIVYVSCNPWALAADLAALSAEYDVAPVQPVDLFPQTIHVESVVALTARD
jgi:23S rRNA (uracil1939-C5)-methyltransferase